MGLLGYWSPSPWNTYPPRHLFEPPTRHYKAGLAHLAWRGGLQSNPMLVNHEQRARDAEHHARAEDLARAAGMLAD